MTILEDKAISLLLEGHPELIGKKIGLSFIDLTSNNLHPILCESISSRAGKYNLIVFNTDYANDSYSEQEVIKNAVETHDIAGFIIWPSTNFDQHAAKYLDAKGIPFILVPHVSDIYQGQFNEVCTPIDATSLAIKHMVAEGAKRIGFVIGDKTNHTVYVQQRYMSYRNILLENNLSVFEPICIPDQPGRPSFTAYSETIIQNLRKFDGIFTATDFLMGLLYKRCIDAGISIPHDLLLTSIDNTPTAQCLDVTSIEQNFPKIALKAIDLMVEILLNPQHPKTQLTVPSELIIRSSSQRTQQ